MERLAQLRAAEGYSLVEALAVLLVLAVLVGAIVSSSVTSQTLGARNQEAAQAVRAAQVAVSAMTRELRQASALMPAGTAAGTCPVAQTASCVDFLVRSRTIDATTQNHNVTRVRFDCTVTYTKAGDPYATTYRSCARYASAEVAEPGVPAPATTLTGTLVARVLNWTTGTCSAADATFTCPIFAYRKSDSTGANGWIPATAATTTAASDAQRINVTLQVPQRGENYARGFSRAILVQDGAQLRNILR